MTDSALRPLSSPLRVGLVLVGLAAASVAVYMALPTASPHGVDPGSEEEAETPDDTGAIRPGPRPVDEFHPTLQLRDDGSRPSPPRPAYGGRVIVHLEAMPKSLNRSIENSAVNRGIHHELHETLIHRDWESWELVPELAEQWIVEDMVLLREDREDRWEGPSTTVRVALPVPDEPVEPVEGEAPPTHREARVLYGRVDGVGGGLRVSPLSEGGLLTEPVIVPGDLVERVEEGTVFTWKLRRGVRWHPSPLVDARDDVSDERKAALREHELDGRDVLFSWDVYNNPHVDGGSARFQFGKVTRADLVGTHTVRMFYQAQYYAALTSVGLDLCILPTHLFDLSDPDNPDHDPKSDPAHPDHDAEAFAKEQGRYINENPHNQHFVGVGPYRLAERTADYVELVRADHYYDDSRAGYADVIRHRLVVGEEATWQAVLNGELDFTYRMQTDVYFGEESERAEFTDHFYKGYYYLGDWSYIGWNGTDGPTSDPVVRRALAHAFDSGPFIQSFYHGLCHEVTGPFPYSSPGYDHSVERYAYDPVRASELLEDAGWYDRDGDGIADRDGEALDLEVLVMAGAASSRAICLALQDDLADIGVRLRITELEWATLRERLLDRQFDAVNLAWTPPLEPDPEQTWHSRWGRPGQRTSNFTSFQDPEVDRLIAEGQRELDGAKRSELWHRVHARVYEAQPYLFLFNVPRKFAMNRDLYGFQSFAMRPGYSVRRWYYPEGTPGTRSTLRPGGERPGDGDGPK